MLHAPDLDAHGPSYHLEAPRAQIGQVFRQFQYPTSPLLPATVTAMAAADALDATWCPFGSLHQLDTAITAAGRTLYAAHRPPLQRALDHLAQ